jgi:hypothetical protein
MDEIEFRKRVDSDPDNIDQELLDAAASNPELQAIIDRSRQLNSKLHNLARATTAPESLKARLLEIPEQGDGQARTPRRAAFFQYYAAAACLLLAVAVGLLMSGEQGPTAAEMAFGEQVIEHLYHEAAELDAINAGNLQRSFGMPAINQVMANSGSRFGSGEIFSTMPVRYANPCLVAKPFNSSHLILQTEQGAINILTIDNPPVSQEFSIGDERFSGIIIPMNGGNLIIVGEKNQNLDGYRSSFENQLEWII